MPGPMCGPALDPKANSWQSVSVPESVDEMQPLGKNWGRECCTYRRIMTFYARRPGYMCWYPRQTPCALT